MTITVKGPDGSTFNFPDDISHEEMQSAMDAHYGDGGPSVGEDVAKSAVSGTGTGVLAIPGMGGDLQNLAQKGANKAAPYVGEGASALSNFMHSHDPTGLYDKAAGGVNKLGDFLRKESARTTKSGIGAGLAEGTGDVPGTYKLPSTADLQGQAEKVTGPFYQPQTGWGRVAHGAASILPTAAAGGEGAVLPLVRSLAAGFGGEGGHQAAEAIKPALPAYMQPYADPVLSTAGSVAGFMGGPRAVTPNPMTNSQYAAVKAADPGVVKASTAGQLTDSPMWRSVEGYSPKGQAAPAAQQEAFTQGALKQAGHEGPLSDVQDTITRNKAERENIQYSNSVNPTEFQRVVNAGARRTPGLSTSSTNLSDVQPYVNTMKDLRYGPAWVDFAPKPPPQSYWPQDIPGPRYQNLHNSIDAKVGAEGTTENVANALKGVKNDLDQGFLNSLPPGTADEYTNLGKQMQHGITVKNAIPKGTGVTTVTPDQLHGAAKFNPEMRNYAENNAKIMSEMPKGGQETPAWFDLASTGAGMLAHGGLGILGGLHFGPEAAMLAGGAGSAEGGVLGHLMKDALYKAGTRGAGGVAMSRPVQWAAKNQIARPSGAEVSPLVLSTLNALQRGNQQ